MLILANVLALALTVADAPATVNQQPDSPPAAPSKEGVVTAVIIGAREIPLGGFEPEAPKPAAAVKPQEVWHLSLAEAIRIGLENSEVVRVITLGPGVTVRTEPAAGAGRMADRADLVIARLNADASIWNFKAAVMAHVRSVEQQYWALSQCQVNLWAREAAVRLGEEIFAREKAGLGRGRADKAGVAEAEQQLENFRLNLVTATSDVIATERQLRNILGLPASDNRRIVLDSAPVEAKVEPDWEACLVLMLSSQPDIAQQEVLVRLTELQLAVAKDQLLPAPRPDALNVHAGMPIGPQVAPVDADQAGRQLAGQRAFLQQVVHQASHSLARFFLEVDANYKLFQTARRLRAAAQQRLEAQRAFYEEGRVTVDRLLDAVGQHASAFAQEAQYKTSYNTSIAALEEAKGTLLVYDGIAVAEGPSPRKAYIQAKDDRVAPASFQGQAPKPEAPRPTPTTYKVRARLGGMQILEVEVEVNEGSPARPGR